MSAGVKTVKSLKCAATVALAFSAALLFVAGCKATDPGSGIQIWQKAWEGETDSRTDPILIKAQGIECGVDGKGDIVFTPRDPTNVLEFPDGSTIVAEEMKVLLRKTDQVNEIGVGPYEMQLNLNGAITLTGPFSRNIQAWFGEQPESGELTALFTGSSKGPMILRCPVHLMAIWVTGKAMKFGTIAREPEKPAEDDTPADGTTPGEQPADGTTPGEQPADGTTPGEQPADGTTPGEQPADGTTPGDKPSEG